MFKKKLVAGLLMSACLSAIHAEAESIWSALKGGTPTVNLRLRYESVDNDSSTVDQDGLILRSAVGYKTGKFMGFSAYAEYEDISAFWEDSYLDNGGILDPQTSDVNHAYVNYENNGLSATVGRQTIIYDNARHIGNVGWRQNDQTYDAATLKYTTGKLALSYNYIWQVNRIVATEEDMETSLFHGSYDFGVVKASAYYYMFDNDDNTGFFAETNDSDTYGLRLTGATKLSDSIKLLYTGEYATQSEGSDATGVDYDADYNLIELGLAFKYVTAKLGYEKLGVDNGYVFTTPLATVHAFNGWADRALPLKATGADAGIEDKYLAISSAFYGVKILGMYHILDADTGAVDYGNEFDIVATYKFKAGPVVGIKSSFYDSDTVNDDTSKFWLWTQYKI